MAHHRHKEHAKHHGKHHKKHGGEVYSGKGSHVVEEAEERKHGGRVHGKHHEEHKAHGHKGHHRLDKRARGGRIGGDMKHSPFTPAHRKMGNGDA